MSVNKYRTIYFIGEASTLLSTTPWTLRRLCHKDVLKFKRMPGERSKLYFTQADIEMNLSLIDQGGPDRARDKTAKAAKRTPANTQAAHAQPGKGSSRTPGKDGGTAGRDVKRVRTARPTAAPRGGKR